MQMWSFMGLSHLQCYIDAFYLMKIYFFSWGSPPFLLSCRFTLAVIGCGAFTIQYILRFSFSIAIVWMVRSPRLNNASWIDLSVNETDDVLINVSSTTDLPCGNLHEDNFVASQVRIFITLIYICHELNSWSYQSSKSILSLVNITWV